MQRCSDLVEHYTQEPVLLCSDGRLLLHSVIQDSFVDDVVHIIAEEGASVVKAAIGIQVSIHTGGEFFNATVLGN